MIEILLALWLTTGDAAMVVRRLAAPAGEAPADWSSSFDGIWLLEESSGTRDNTGTCGGTPSDCDLSEVNPPIGNDTTNKMEGSAAADFTAANTEYLTCADATCTTLDYSSDASWGCWARATQDSQDRIIDKEDTTDGYRLQRRSQDEQRCSVEASNVLVHADGANNSWPNDNAYYHVACVFDDVSNTLQPFLNGATSGSGSTANALGASTRDFELSANTSGAAWEGQLDECWTIGDVLTAAEICRICSIQIDGGLGWCDDTPTAYEACSTDADCNGRAGACNTTDSLCTGRNDSKCLGCTLPACNAAAP
jgi:hypothetical protein